MIHFESERSVPDYFYHQSDENLSFPIHIHNSYEFFAVLEGKIDVMINSRQYTLSRGQATLILPQEPHSYISHDSAKSYLCIFSTNYVPSFNNLMRGKENLSPVFSLENPEKVVQMLKDAEDLLLRKGLLYCLSSLYIKNGKIVQKEALPDNFMAFVLEKIQENYGSNLTLNDIAVETGYDYAYCSHLIHNAFGCSFTKLLNDFRIANAIEQLENTDKRIGEIALSCGFNSLRQFNRVFLERKGMTPTSFRQIKDKTKSSL